MEMRSLLGTSCKSNYDYNKITPAWDDRRTPGKKHLEHLGQNALINTTSILQILKMWPTFNHHTDVTAVMSPCALKNGIWSDGTWQHSPSTQSHALYV